MLTSLFGGTDISSYIVSLLYRLPAILIAISFHEYAHALMAHWLGDDTAKMYGRLTVNPAAHFDIWGTLCMLFVGFGWANPVPFNYRNLKKPKRDTALIAVAGPIMNFIIALAAAVIYSFLAVIFIRISTPNNIKLLNIILQVVAQIYILNLSLMVFNILPIPPLDGSKVLFSLLPAKCYNFILNYERYGMTILVVLLLVGGLDVPLNFLVNLISAPLENIMQMIITALI